ncbi:MAG: class I SAM-dependent DNA methyltransferase, partial [Chloroflexi bacterium]|nr:class I SAM-dependent DNA methyltransferase [Chloroflexota bacterium]
MLSSPQQLALPLEKHRNHYLFSDYYLNTLLPRQPDWREADVQAAQALKAIRQLYTDRHALLRPTVGEPALEDQWIRPILDLLGHTYHVQPSLPSPEGSRTPDYALFADEAAHRAALPHLGTAEFFGAALAVADAKRWDRSLDKRLTDGAGDAFSNANPSYQIDYYLRISKRDWGLLTNGRLWRLYSRESSFRLDCYYEVDLITLLEQGQVQDFKYFYLFFRRAAFPEFLDRVLQESRE